jgi:DNA-binding NtrC family response regulator
LSGGTKILVVEDDPLVSDVIEAVLEDTYPVALTETAADALNVLRQQEICLVLLDCTLPGGISPDLLQEADQKGTPVILMSGDPDRMRSISQTPRPFLRKPFTLAGLRGTIESVLTTPTGGVSDSP